MEKYYIVGLTQDEVAGRALTRIADAIREVFFQSSQAAVKRQIPNPKQAWAKINFEDPMTSPDFEEKYKDYFSVLYLNQVAKDILDEKGVSVNVIREIETLPENIGVFISMPRYVAG